VTTTVEALEQKTAAARGQLHVNCGFWGGLVPANAHRLEPLLETGIFGIKAFLTHSGIDEFPNVSREHLEAAMPVIARHHKPLLAHSELDRPHDGQGYFDQHPYSYDAFLQSRPKDWEDRAIELLLKLCDRYRCRTHLVHLSSANKLHDLEAAKAAGLPLTVETCQHYLFFDAEEIPDRDSRFKCAPPIREKLNNEQLWQALQTRLLDFVVTDHSPSTPEMKRLESGNLLEAWGGIASLQFALPAFWTPAKERDFTIAAIAELTSTNIALFLGLEDCKGQIAKGFDADLVIWQPEASSVFNAADVRFRHFVTPYEGQQLFGKVEQTWVNGQKVFDRGRFPNLQAGNLLFSGR